MIVITNEVKAYLTTDEICCGYYSVGYLIFPGDIGRYFLVIMDSSSWRYYPLMYLYELSLFVQLWLDHISNCKNEFGRRGSVDEQSGYWLQLGMSTGKADDGDLRTRSKHPAFCP